VVQIIRSGIYQNVHSAYALLPVFSGRHAGHFPEGGIEIRYGVKPAFQGNHQHGHVRPGRERFPGKGNALFVDVGAEGPVQGAPRIRGRGDQETRQPLRGPRRGRQGILIRLLSHSPKQLDRYNRRW